MIIEFAKYDKKPQVGDYVICYVDNEPKDFQHFLSINIGKLVNIVQSSGFGNYEVEYEKNDDIFNDNDNIIHFEEEDIIHFGTKDEMEFIITTKKYNI